jgi:outer membrane protein assembly factor BamB
MFIVVVAAAVAAVFLAVHYSGGTDDAADATPTATSSFLREEPSELAGAFEAHAVDGTWPSDFGLTFDIMEDGAITESYIRPQGMAFPSSGAPYTNLAGITTFRGGSSRDAPGYGTADVTEEKLELLWNIDSGALTRWTGSGYTGQPLIVQWDDSMRQIMNLYPEKKAKKDLKEVIYPTMDGKIYFIDLEDGTPTRDPVEMGFTVKGTASIDPRGYPILYVGQSIGLSGDASRDDSFLHIYSLIDGSKLYEYGFTEKDPFSYRDSWQAWDSSPLVAADTDTLIWPGENGIVYTFDLHSRFDRSAGAVTVSPDEPVKYRYTTPENGDDALLDAQPNVRLYGIESSAAAYMNYLYFTDNGGWLQCVDLNTMSPVWVQDVTDDSDATMVLEEDGENVYLYTGSKFDRTSAEDAAEGSAYARKIDAMTGEIVWEVPCECFAVAGGESGILASPALGGEDLDGMVFYTVASAGAGENAGLMLALDKETGEEIWRIDMERYAWSSPVPIYTGAGTGYILQCDSGGNMMLVGGRDGEIVNTVSLESGVEASPAVFGDIAVVGTRGEKIYGIKIK